MWGSPRKRLRIGSIIIGVLLWGAAVVIGVSLARIMGAQLGIVVITIVLAAALAILLLADRHRHQGR
jgi:hypothetical protein